MAQMRVKDQDLIVEQVVKKIEATELEKFKAREDVQSIQSVIETRIDMIKTLHNTYKEYEQNIRDDIKELVELVDLFQEVNNFKEANHYANSTGFRLRKVSSYGSPEVPEYDIAWKLPYNTKDELAVKLSMQTMSGDFDVYKLIDE
jgi:L-asparaginase/Glu-tRNA(Gln) amidotransferase subunit D